METLKNFFLQYHPRNAILLLAFLMFAAWRAGWQLGKRASTPDRTTGRRAGSKFDDASLALLGLLLAFTFGMSLNKHDNRRDMVVTDANAIRDFYMSASLLNEPARSKLRAVIRDYVALRIQIADSPDPDPELKAALPHFRMMFTEMREMVTQAVADNAPHNGMLVNNFNRVSSANALRLAAVRDRLPPEILILLFVSALVATILVGREQGIAGKAEFAGTLGFILLVTLAIYVTLDLNEPRSGLVKVSQTPIRELLSSMPK